MGILLEGVRDTVRVADDATLDQMKADYQTLRTGLDAIQADLAPGGTLQAHAATLSTITVTSLAQVQTVLRTLGADQQVFLQRMYQESQGLERVLDALAVFVRRARSG